MIIQKKKKKKYGIDLSKNENEQKKHGIDGSVLRFIVF